MSCYRHYLDATCWAFWVTLIAHSLQFPDLLVWMPLWPQMDGSEVQWASPIWSKPITLVSKPTCQGVSWREGVWGVSIGGDGFLGHGIEWEGSNVGTWILRLGVKFEPKKPTKNRPRGWNLTPFKGLGTYWCFFWNVAFQGLWCSRHVPFFWGDGGGVRKNILPREIEPSKPCLSKDKMTGNRLGFLTQPGWLNLENFLGLRV